MILENVMAPRKIPIMTEKRIILFFFVRKFEMTSVKNSNFFIKTKIVPPLIPGIRLTTPIKKPVKKFIFFTNLFYV